LEIKPVASANKCWDLQLDAGCRVFRVDEQGEAVLIQSVDLPARPDRSPKVMIMYFISVSSRLACRKPPTRCAASRFPPVL
jgi:hypothetical protein